MLTLDSVGRFSWGFGNKWFILVGGKAYEWSDPSYPGGLGTIRPFHGTYKHWCRKLQIPYGRDKGTHVIRDYCGEDVKIFS